MLRKCGQCVQGAIRLLTRLGSLGTSSDHATVRLRLTTSGGKATSLTARKQLKRSTSPCRSMGQMVAGLWWPVDWIYGWWQDCGGLVDWSHGSVCVSTSFLYPNTSVAFLYYMQKMLK